MNRSGRPEKTQRVEKPNWILTSPSLKETSVDWEGWDLARTPGCQQSQLAGEWKGRSFLHWVRGTAWAWKHQGTRWHEAPNQDTRSTFVTIVHVSRRKGWFSLVNRKILEPITQAPPVGDNYGEVLSFYVQNFIYMPLLLTLNQGQECESIGLETSRV